MKGILVTFDLANATGAHYTQAYRYLAALGLHSVANGVSFPSTVVVGPWYQQSSPAEIRNALWTAMRGLGIPLSRLLVAEYAEMAWFGDKV
jgi:hypothetical protein